MAGFFLPLPSVIQIKITLMRFNVSLAFQRYVVDIWSITEFSFFFLMPFHSGFGSLQETLLNQAPF